MDVRPHLISVGLSHRHAPVAVRERIARHRVPLAESLERLSTRASERVLLSTCQRFELYAITTALDADTWIDALCAAVDVPRPFADDHFVARDGLSAVNHLLHVAAGLDSKVVGEDQVLAQVRGAFIDAVNIGAVGPILSALFRTAIHVGRSVRRETGINVAPRSLAHLAVAQLGAAASGDVVILGTGAMARESLALIKSPTAGRITVVSRHVERAAELASTVGADYAGLERLEALVARCSGLICCTTARRYLIDVPRLASRHARLTIVDLGMPRNVDPDVARLPHVDLVHLDDLPEYQALSQQMIERARAILRSRQERFVHWLHARPGAPRMHGLEGEHAA